MAGSISSRYFLWFCFSSMFPGVQFYIDVSWCCDFHLCILLFILTSEFLPFSSFRFGVSWASVLHHFLFPRRSSSSILLWTFALLNIFWSSVSYPTLSSTPILFRLPHRHFPFISNFHITFTGASTYSSCYGFVFSNITPHQF